MALSGNSEPSRVDEAQSGERRRKADLFSRLFVWGVWAAMALIAIGCVYAYSSGVPNWDEWDDIVPVLTGDQHVTLSWLWSQHNEHRIFLPRLVIIGLLKATHGDFRSGVYLNLMLMIGMSAAGILTAERIRGQPRFDDALFPLLLLSLRSYQILLWMFECQVLMAFAFAFINLLIISRFGGSVPDNLLIVCSLCCIAIPLCGAFGLSMAPPLAIWAAVVAGSRIRRGQSETATPGGRFRQAQTWTALVMAGASIALVGWYFVGLELNPAPPPTFSEFLQTLFRLLGSGIGDEGVAPGTVAIDISQVLCLLFAVGIIRLGWIRDPEDRLRSAGMALFLLGAFGVDCALAFGRNGNAIQSRYFFLTCQLVIGIYFTCLTKGEFAANRLAKSIMTGLFVLGLVLTGATIQLNAHNAMLYQQSRLDFENGIYSRVSLPRLIAVYGNELYPSNESLAERIVRLSAQGLGAFRGYDPQLASRVQPLVLDNKTIRVFRRAADSSLQSVPVSLNGPTATVASPLDGRTEIIVSPSAKPLHLVGFRLRCDLPQVGLPRPDATVYVRWRHAGQDYGKFMEWQLLTFHDPTIHKRAVLFIDDTVDAIKLEPVGNYPSIKITGIDLLIPGQEN